MAIQITLPRIYASNHFGYAVSAKDLYSALFPLSQSLSLPQSEQLKHGQIPFSQWLDHRVRFYGFEAGYDYALLEETRTHHQTDNDVPDLSLSLNMAKELARLERTEHGRSVRYYLIDFEQDLSRGNRGNAKNQGGSSQNENGKLDKKVKQLNQLAQSIKVGDNVMVVPTVDVVDLIKAIREYQIIADLYLKPEHKINPIWVNEVIEQLKYKTGKLLQDEQNNQLI